MIPLWVSFELKYMSGSTSADVFSAQELDTFQVSESDKVVADFTIRADEAKTKSRVSQRFRIDPQIRKRHSPPTVVAPFTCFFRRHY